MTVDAVGARLAEQREAARRTLHGEGAPMRAADEVLDPTDMGGARYTRHSFSRALVRRAAGHGWRVARELFDVDDLGRGTVSYRVDAEGHTFTFVAFSTKLEEAQRTDRVVAKAWDVTGALVEGVVDRSRAELLADQVVRQENGRAEEGTIIWTRANRSERFFDYVASRLARGLQPEPATMGSAAYVLRSTAFYSNGKFGLADFERFDGDHPLGVPYRAHMLAAWLLRELSYDLVEHVARSVSANAVRLSGEWRRFLGLGNATGLGMVPYVVNHPAVLDAWARLREAPLAFVLAQQARPDDPEVARVVRLLDRACDYLESQSDLATAPYPDSASVAQHVRELADVAREYAENGTLGGKTSTLPWQELHDVGARLGPAARGVLASVLVELTETFDQVVEDALRVDETLAVRTRMTCGELEAERTRCCGWSSRFDFEQREAQHHFWFSSAENEEPRRAVRSQDPGEPVEHRVDVARALAFLGADLAGVPEDLTVAEFLLARPWHRQTIARVQAADRLAYAELRANLVSSRFVPLDVQRFQLAVYGMESFSPQSTDWLRVTLFSGAPRVAELSAGSADDDWIFVRRPQGAQA